MVTCVWKVASCTLDLTARTAVMGILNVTPDSFSDGGLYIGVNEALAHARRMEEEGAAIIDIGAQSTRPGAVPLSADEEWARLEPILRRLREQTRLPLSVDTYFPEVARAALEVGADILNDVSGSLTNGFPLLAARYGAGLVMTRPGDPQQALPVEQTLPTAVAYVRRALSAADAVGLPREQVCIDPGIGFGTSREGDRVLLAHLDQLGVPADVPLLVGASRKRVTVDGSDPPPAPAERVGGTIALHTIAQWHGARVLRVHDVAVAVQAARAIDLLKGV